MPHKDREARLAYLRGWKERQRPAPAPEPQRDPSLPPLGAMVFSSDGERVQCHACGKWLGSLNTHIRQHSYDAAGYKHAFGLGRTASLWPPALKARQRAAALARDQGEVGRQHLPHDGSGRPAGQEARLAVRIAASVQRKGVHPRAGGHTGDATDDLP